MSRYIIYNPEQAWLLPPSVRGELGEGHLAVFVHELVERLDLKQFEAEHSEEGRPSYPPQLLLKVWLYAYAVGVTSCRRLEQRIREDLGFRFLAGQLKPDHWTLNDFRRRHPKALNDVFTQVVEAARAIGLGRLGRVAIDRHGYKPTHRRIAAIASSSCDERARIRQRIRRWQKQCDQENAGALRGSTADSEAWKQRLDEIRLSWRSCENRGNSGSAS